jgi:NAD+ synthase
MKNIKKDIEEISLWLKDYANKNGFKGYVLGLSGGIDSAVSLGLAINAIGKENVRCFALPCTQMSEKMRKEDLEDAKLLAKTFGVSLEIIGLDSTLENLYNQFDHYNKKNKPLVVANIKARLRMVTLRALAESLDCLVLGTTNKTEEYLGYFTKAGDGGPGVDIEPIADFFKYEIKELAKELGVPDKIINKVPSAGLWENQTDEGEIGFSYDEIDKYLVIREEILSDHTPLFLESTGKIYKLDMLVDFMKNKVKSLKFSDGLIEKVEKMISFAEHKRNNPPYFKR